jgi:hypothetical protein
MRSMNSSTIGMMQSCRQGFGAATSVAFLDKQSICITLQYKLQSIGRGTVIPLSSEILEVKY